LEKSFKVRGYVKDYWGEISERFDEWTAPLRPSPEDVEMFRNLLDPTSKTLLLGVTTELQSLVTIAVDHNPRAIEIHRANAVLGDWRDLPFGPEFDAVIGDGSLNVFQGAPELFFQQTQKVLKKKGSLSLRVFISPETKEDLASVIEKKGEMGFHAFKWRVAQALANPYVRVKDLYCVMKPVYDDPTLELYRESDLIYYFPKLSDLPPWNKIQFGTSYELADRCPVITWNF
jgi:SAM-dependent methyltransferase